MPAVDIKIDHVNPGQVGGLAGLQNEIKIRGKQEIPPIPSVFPNLADPMSNPNIQHINHLTVKTLRVTNLPPIPPNLRTLTLENVRDLTVIPQLPDSVHYLRSHVNPNLQTITNLPNQLAFLHVKYTSIQTLGPLPNTIHTLYVESNQINQIQGDLPASLRTIHIKQNELPNFPSTANCPQLRSLGISDNQLTEIGPFGPGLETIGLKNNRLTALPDLPPALEVLNVHNNQLTALPALPATLEVLVAHHNKIRRIPDLPPNLRVLDISQNPLDEPWAAILRDVQGLGGNANGPDLPPGNVFNAAGPMARFPAPLGLLTREQIDAARPRIAELNRRLPLARDLGALRVAIGHQGGVPEGPVGEALGIPDDAGPLSIIGQMLSGARGSLAQQAAAVGPRTRRGGGRRKPKRNSRKKRSH